MSAYFESLGRGVPRTEPARPAPAAGPPAVTTLRRVAPASAPAVRRGAHPAERRPVVRPVVAPPAPTFAGHYAALRERLLFLGLEHPLRAIVFAGCRGDEGSGEIVRAFGETLAASGLEVLLLAVAAPDAVPAPIDLAKLVVHHATVPADVHGSGELTTVTAFVSDEDKDRFYRSAEFASWLDRQRELYDWVLFDAPPLLRFRDGALVGGSCDGVVIVVESGVTDHEALVEARERLERSGVRVIGAVLNRVRDELPAWLRPWFAQREGRGRPGSTWGPAA